MRVSRKALYFWPVAAAVFLTDCATKSAAEHYLAGSRYPHPFLGDFLRFTLTYNQAAAMSLNLGSLSRPILIVVAGVTMGVLLAWYHRPGTETTPMALPLALVWAGAAGNLWDRVRGARGVVDFIDVGLNGWRFWIFNVADIAITCGAIGLALVLSRRPQRKSAV
jgi:signal peptidase II